MSTLDDNLIVDFENGSDYVEALKVKINTIDELIELINALKKSSHKYKFITIDTITALEEFVKPMALTMYNKTPAGATFKGDITTAPMGIGYSYIRQALEKVIDLFSEQTTNLIIVGHVKDKSIISVEDKEECSVKDLDLLGKSSRILAAKSDGICFIYRDEHSNLCFNFANEEGYATVGARPDHLANKKIIIAEKQEDGTFISHWDRIYPSLRK